MNRHSLIGLLSWQQDPINCVRVLYDCHIQSKYASSFAPFTWLRKLGVMLSEWNWDKTLVVMIKIWSGICWKRFWTKDIENGLRVTINESPSLDMNVLVFIWRTRTFLSPVNFHLTAFKSKSLFYFVASFLNTRQSHTCVFHPYFFFVNFASS